MASVRVAERYSKSLLDLSVENGVVDKVYADIQQFKDALESRDLKNLLRSPIIKRTKKYDIIQKLFREGWQPLTLKFFEVVIRKDREDTLPEIADAFFEQYNKHKGITKVRVIAAKKMDAATLKNIEEKLLKSGTTRARVQFNTEVDPSLIGGFILEYDNNRYDVSVRSKLRDLRKKLVN